LILYIKRAKEDDKVLDVIFDKCFKLGKHVPLLQPYCAALKEAAPMKRCLAFMYEDLLEFYARILKYFSQRSKLLDPTVVANCQCPPS